MIQEKSKTTLYLSNAKTGTLSKTQKYETFPYNGRYELLLLLYSIPVQLRS
jgi:hypothetical protein